MKSILYIENYLKYDESIPLFHFKNEHNFPVDLL